jgi:hypothetical protein
MKRVYVAYERFAQGGKVFTDGDGCNYLKPHTHSLLAGKEFCNTTEALTVIHDHNNANPRDKFQGEVIFLEVFSF